MSTISENQSQRFLGEPKYGLAQTLPIEHRAHGCGNIFDRDDLTDVGSDRTRVNQRHQFLPLLPGEPWMRARPRTPSDTGNIDVRKQQAVQPDGRNLSSNVP